MAKTQRETVEQALAESKGALVHVWGPREDTSTQPHLYERFCRPGAAFGFPAVELRMGAKVVYHEHSFTSAGRMKCSVCRCVAVD